MSSGAWSPGKVHPAHWSPMRTQKQVSSLPKSVHNFTTPQPLICPYLPGQRLCSPAAEMIQHLADLGEDSSEGEPLPAYPRPTVATPVHRVNRRTTILKHQAVTQPAAPQPPALPRRTQQPRGASRKSTVDLLCLSPRGAVPRYPVTSTAQFPFRASETQTRTPWYLCACA